MSRASFFGKTALETCFMLPLVLPPTVVGFILIVIFGKHSFIGQAIEWIFQQPVIFTWWAAVIASAVVAFPLMYQSAKTGFADIDPDIQGAAMVDGASRMESVYPYLRPACLSFIADRKHPQPCAGARRIWRNTHVCREHPRCYANTADGDICRIGFRQQYPCLGVGRLYCCHFLFDAVFHSTEKNALKKLPITGSFLIKTEAHQDLGRHAHLYLMRQFCPCLLETIRNQKYKRFR